MKKWLFSILSILMTPLAALTASAEGETAAAETASFPVGKWLFAAVLIGVVVGLIVVAVLKGQLKSVHREAAAANYIRKDSMQLSTSTDTFLYRKVEKTPIPKSAPPASRK